MIRHGGHSGGGHSGGFHSYSSRSYGRSSYGGSSGGSISCTVLGPFFLPFLVGTIITWVYYGLYTNVQPIDQMPAYNTAL